MSKFIFGEEVLIYLLQKLTEQNKYHPIHDSKYSNVDPELLPTGESLKMTCDRVLPYFSSSIAPLINDKKNSNYFSTWK